MPTILLIGAGGGMGFATARLLLQRGWDVIATVSQPEKIAAFNAALPGCRETIALTLSDSATTLADLKALVARLDTGLDAVMVCAAISPTVPLELMKLDLAHHAVEVNLLSNLAIYQAVLPALRRSKGRLIFTSSLSGRVSAPMVGLYSATKFALEGLADAMRQEVDGTGVQIIVLQPGGIDSGMLTGNIERVTAALPALSPEEHALYGDLYKQFRYRMASAREERSNSQPEFVAEAAVRALEDPEPRTRYPIGPDAEYLLDAASRLSDREMDTLILGAYRSAPI